MVVCWKGRKSLEGQGSSERSSVRMEATGDGLRRGRERSRMVEGKEGKVRREKNLIRQSKSTQYLASSFCYEKGDKERTK